MIFQNLIEILCFHLDLFICVNGKCALKRADGRAAYDCLWPSTLSWGDVTLQCHSNLLYFQHIMHYLVASSPVSRFKPPSVNGANIKKDVCHVTDADVYSWAFLISRKKNYYILASFLILCGRCDIMQAERLGPSRSFSWCQVCGHSERQWVLRRKKKSFIPFIKLANDIWAACLLSEDSVEALGFNWDSVCQEAELFNSGQLILNWLALEDVKL